MLSAAAWVFLPKHARSKMPLATCFGTTGNNRVKFVFANTPRRNRQSTVTGDVTAAL
jgi:hypothetical protein